MPPYRRRDHDLRSRRVYADSRHLARHPLLQPGPRRRLGRGIVITPSHNPPDDGGFKYNPPNGGPAGSDITKSVENQANEFLKSGLSGVRRIPFAEARNAPSTHIFDYVDKYVSDRASVLDLDAIRSAGLKLGVDPLGGADVDYWQPIADRRLSPCKG